MKFEWRGYHEVVGTLKPYLVQKNLNFLDLQAVGMKIFHYLLLFRFVSRRELVEQSDLDPSGWNCCSGYHQNNRCWIHVRCRDGLPG